MCRSHMFSGPTLFISQDSLCDLSKFLCLAAIVQHVVVFLKRHPVDSDCNELCTKNKTEKFRYTLVLFLFVFFLYLIYLAPMM